MMDKIKKVESLLEDYYSTEDEFVRTDIPIIIMQNYVDWMIETIKNQQAEIDTLSMAHDDMHRLLPKDKHFLIKSNIALNRRVQELEFTTDLHVDEVTQLDELVDELKQQNKRYRETLEFYADEKNYKHNGSMGHIIYSMTMYDKGKKARTALEGDLE